MSTGNITSNWFEGVSDKVKCLNCQHWDGPSDFEIERGDREGQCRMIPAYGGAFHMAGTDQDMFCSEFEIKPNV